MNKICLTYHDGSFTTITVKNRDIVDISKRIMEQMASFQEMNIQDPFLVLNNEEEVYFIPLKNIKSIVVSSKGEKDTNIDGNIMGKKFSNQTFDQSLDEAMNIMLLSRYKKEKQKSKGNHLKGNDNLGKGKEGD